MKGFRRFVEVSEEQADIRRTIGKLPKSHQNFLRGFTISFQGGNTLHGDDQHIGVIQTEPRPHITIAAPWSYGREYATLHEIAHLVYPNMVDSAMKKEWEQIVARTKGKQNQSPEELFCMAYANHYANHKIVVHTHPEWEQFIARLPQ